MSPKNSIIAYQAVDVVLRNVLRWIPVSPFTEWLALAWGYRYRPDPRIVKLRSGALIQTTQVDHLQLLLYYLGTFEPHCLEVMRRHVKQGDIILDVGANIGLFSIEGAAAVGPSGRVISIEAAPHHAKSICESAALNEMGNVEVNAIAVGDTCGEATLTLPRNTNFGMFTLGKVDGDESFIVQVRTIDAIVNGAKVDFIKMDIEGSEYRALLGAEDTLTKFHPTILIELNEAALNACGASSRQVKDLLAAHGYRGQLTAGQPLMNGMLHVCDECLFTYGGGK